jgi:hypothetical protein
MVKMPPDDYARLEKTIKFYEWALANYAEFIRTERKPRTKVNLQKRLIALQDEARHARSTAVRAHSE